MEIFAKGEEHNYRWKGEEEDRASMTAAFQA